jgi:hypothetical protein
LVSPLSDRIDGRHHSHGQAGLPLQAPGVRLPVLGDLRWARLGVGLRSARRGAQEEREGPLVARPGARARRHRGDRRRHSDAPQGLGGLRTRGGIHRPAGGLPALQEPLPRRRSADQRHTRSARRAVPGLRQQRHAHRAAPLQSHVQDVHGAGGGAGRGGLPPPGDGAGDLRQLPQRAPELSASRRSARHSGTRSRRATSSSGPANSSRWRCSSS